MKAHPDQLAKQLQSELGVDAINREADVLACAAVDGKQPTMICSPTNAAGVCAALRVCGEAGAAVDAGAAEQPWSSAIRPPVSTSSLT